MVRHQVIETTAYCSCGHCCKWEWGLKIPGPFYIAFAPSLVFLQLRRKTKAPEDRVPLISKYWTGTSQVGQPYRGLTAYGTVPAQARPAIFSSLSLKHLDRIPGRLLLFPWRFLPKTGTIAADTKYFPFGTQMFVPGYGWGKVEDRGSAIKGPSRVDLYHKSHKDALHWGRRKLKVMVLRPGESLVDSWHIPGPLKVAIKALDWSRRLIF